jgi:hypothetical protein
MHSQSDMPYYYLFVMCAAGCSTMLQLQIAATTSGMQYLGSLKALAAAAAATVLVTSVLVQ